MQRRSGSTVVESTEHQYEIFSFNLESRKIHSFQREDEDSRPILIVAANHLGEGVVLRSEHQDDQFRLHSLIDSSLKALHGDIRANLRDELSLTVERLGESQYLFEDGRIQHNLTREQKAALEATLSHGYYEAPRRNTLFATLQIR